MSENTNLDQFQANEDGTVIVVEPKTNFGPLPTIKLETKSEVIPPVTVDIPMPQGAAVPIKKSRPWVFRAIQYGPHLFWVICGSSTGVLCSKKAEGINQLKELYPGDYIVEDKVFFKKPEDVTKKN